jgi:hypothetical protein
MSDLRPCPECRRHARADESACPFCAAALAPAAPVSMPVGRLTRAAVFTAGAAIAGAACGGKTAPAQDPIDNTATAIDAGVDEQQPPDAAPYTPPPDHDVPMPYGAPPARERVV